jgi:hypothetical protein
LLFSGEIIAMWQVLRRSRDDKDAINDSSF